MRVKLLLVLLFAMLLKVQAKNLKLKPIISSRIFEGKQVTAEEFPYQVAILNQNKLLCGGTILNQKIVITAAHCIDNENVSSLRVRAGSANPYFGGQIRNVSCIRIHQAYDRVTYEYDIALMVLEKKLNFSSPDIGKIVLPKKEVLNGTRGVVSGFGIYDPFHSNDSFQLRAANMTVLSWNECASSKYRYNNLPKSMICAQADGIGACRHDEGGPLVIKRKLVGIVLVRPICAFPTYPGVYLNVALVTHWIQDITKMIISVGKVLK